MLTCVAAFCGARGGDDRLDLERAVRDQHHLRLAAPRIRADGDLAEHQVLPPALRLPRAEYVNIIRKPWATGPSDYRDDFFRMDNCRGPPRPMAEIRIICAAQSDAGAVVARAIRRLQFQQWRPGEPATRRGKERRAVDRGERQGEGAIAARCCCTADKTDTEAMAMGALQGLGSTSRRSPTATRGRRDHSSKAPFS